MLQGTKWWFLLAGDGGEEEMAASDIVLSGAYSALPAAGTEGRLYVPTDSAYDMLRDTGAAWQHFRNGRLMTPFVPGDFAWINQGDATIYTAGGFTKMYQSSASVNLALLKKTAPSTPYTITVAFIPNLWSQNYVGAGLVFRQSSDGKLVVLNPMYINGHYLNVQQWANPTTSGATLDTRGYIPASSGQPVWLRIEDDGTNRKYYVSLDGEFGDEIYSEGRTTYLTADEVGFCCWVNNTVDPMDASILHWAEA